MAHRFARPRASAAARGYDAAHQAVRRALIARYTATDPCCLCGQPLGTNTRAIHLDHNPAGGYRGLAHARCNMRDGASRGARLVNARRNLRASRAW